MGECEEGEREGRRQSVERKGERVKEWRNGREWKR